MTKRDVTFEREDDESADESIVIDEDSTESGGEEDDEDTEDEEEEEEESVEFIQESDRRKGGGRRPPAPAPAANKKTVPDETLHDLMNPVKRLPREQIEDDDDSMEQEDDSQEGEDDGYEAPPHPPPPPPVHPADGYDTLEQEKADLLTKLDRIRRKGTLNLRNLDFNSDILEIRAEMMRVKSSLELDQSIAFGKKMLMATVSTLEFLNKRYDPFDLALDGWGESVMDNIDTYDGVLEKLYYKYRNRVAMPPEMELLLSLAGSAFMFHMTNSMFKKMLPTGGGGSGGISPDVLKNVMGAMMGGVPPGPAARMPPAQPTQPPPAPPAPAPAPPSQASAGAYKMKVPDMEVSGLMSMMKGLNLAPEMPKPTAFFQPAPTRDAAVSVREIGGGSGDILPSPPPPPPQKPRDSSRQDARPPPPPIDDDRLSDVISEDLESIRSVSSISNDSIKHVEIVAPVAKRGGRGAGRGRGRGRGLALPPGGRAMDI